MPKFISSSPSGVIIVIALYPGLSSTTLIPRPLSFSFNSLVACSSDGLFFVPRLVPSLAITCSPKNSGFI